MDTERAALTVFFEQPFWVGVFERHSGGELSACKVTFGAEPKDYEVLDFILKHYTELQFSPAVETTMKQTADSPKRRQRSARKQVQLSGVATRSQQALQRQREARRVQKKRISKAQKDAEKQRRFDLKQQKRKAKHRGH